MRRAITLVTLLVLITMPKETMAQWVQSGSDEYQQFVDRYVCPISSALLALSKSTLTRNQFIILKPKEDPSKYVQCLFKPNEPIYCEATSYYFRNVPGEPERYRMSAEKRKVLEEHSFTFQPKGNFFLSVMRPLDSDYEPMARFLLTILYDAYDVRLSNRLRIDVPPELDTTSACRPAVS